MKKLLGSKATRGINNDEGYNNSDVLEVLFL